MLCFPVNTLIYYLCKGSILILIGRLRFSNWKYLNGPIGVHIYTYLCKGMSVLTGKRFETLSLPNYIQFCPIHYSRSTKNVYEYMLSGVGNSTKIGKIFKKKSLPAAVLNSLETMAWGSLGSKSEFILLRLEVESLMPTGWDPLRPRSILALPCCKVLERLLKGWSGVFESEK